MNINKKIIKAEGLAKLGRIDEGLTLLLEVIKQFPKQPKAHSLIGLFYILKMQPGYAKEHLIKSLTAEFDNDVASNLINLLIQNKAWKEAYQWSQKLLQNKNLKEINLINHARILRELDYVNDSIDWYEKIIKEYPNNIDAKVSYIYSLNKIERYQKAIEICLQGLNLDPKNQDLIYNTGITFLNDKDFDNAIYYIKLCLENNYKSFELWLTLAECYLKKRQFNDAIDSVNYAEKLQPDSPLIPFQFGIILLHQDKNEEAIKKFEKALELDQDHIESKYHIALIKLKQEKYKEAMPYYKYRTIRPKYRLGRFNDTNQIHIDKHTDLLISWEQGVGDTILFLSLIDEVKDFVKSITFISQDKLLDLVKLNYPTIDVIPENNADRFINENPKLQMINIGTIMNYIKNWEYFFNKKHIWKVSEKLRQYYLDKYKRKNEILLGLSWMSANKKIGDEKSIPLNQLSSIISNQKTISLQYGDVQDEINKVNQDKSLNIIHDDELDYFNDINSLAALISICDIVVTCSNVTAHIAGRLGIRTYLIIPKFFGNIWYWNESQHQSRWYPSVTIIRQKIDMSWDDPIQEVKKQLSFA